MSIDSYNKGMKDAMERGGARALNERTRLKMALQEIMGEMGHDTILVAFALEDVCNCDFRGLRTLFGLEPGESHAKENYESLYEKQAGRI